MRAKQVFFFFNRFVCNDCRSNDVTFIIEDFTGFSHLE